MHRSTILGIAGTAFLSIAVGLLVASLFLQPAPASRQMSADNGSAEAVQAFYSAANEAIATGSIAALEAIVAPHFVDREQLPGMRPGRDGLGDYLLALHVAMPGVELAAEPILAAGDRAMARVTIQGSPQPALQGVIAGQPMPWAPVEVFRVADGRIVERWSQMEGLALSLPLARATLVLAAPAPRQITLARVTLDAGVNWQPAPPGPALLYLEQGTLRVESGSPEQSVTLPAGRTMALTPGTSGNVTNLGVQRAELLLVTFHVPEVPGPQPGEAATLPPGVTSTVIAGDLAADVSSGPVTLEIGQIILAPRARLMLSSADGPALISVDAGELDVTSWGRVWIRDGHDGMSRDSRLATLQKGDSALLDVASQLSIENAGRETVHALGLAIRPAGAG